MQKNGLARVLAFLLCLTMLVTMLPLGVWAEEIQQEDTVVQENEIVQDGEENPDGDEIPDGEENPNGEEIPDGEENPDAEETPDDNENADEEINIYEDAVNVSTGEQLAEALRDEAGAICITGDFLLDQSFYVTKNTVVYTKEAHILTRDPGFGGDIFVVGEQADGTACESPVKLTLGDPESSKKDLLVIDGNKDNMTVNVTGSVLFVVGGAAAELYENVTITNHKKLGNEKTLTEKYGVSYVDQVGGAVAIIAKSASMDIFGGTYSNNAVSDVANSDSNHGGAFYNFGVLNIYGGVFQTNYAARGAVVYGYRTTRIYKAQILNNAASTYGGAIYMPNSTSAFLFLGGENNYVDSAVVFRENTAVSGGGAIYARNKIDVQDAQFVSNSATSGSGGAITVGETEIIITNVKFDGNTANKYGGAIYYSTTKGKEDITDLTCVNTVFQNNSVSASGGALYMSGEATAYMENTTFTQNAATNNGGAMYLNNADVDINGGSFTKNSCSATGGAIAGYEESSVKLNQITASENSAKSGGFVYCENFSPLHIYDSTLQENSATGNGGAVHMVTGANGGIYNTTFHKNTSGSSGGALYIYTSGYDEGNKVVLHSCTYTENEAVYGGAIYTAKQSVIDLYNSVAKRNTAGKGGFLYHTAYSTTVNLASLILEGNTATDGPIIFGNTLNAKLNLDKALYIDRDATGDLDDAYWAGAIANLLTVNDVVIDVPNYIGYDGGEVVPVLPRIAVDITSAEELEAALASGKELLHITADFTINRTFYIWRNTTIYTTEAHTLTRAADFAGDIFVVGERAAGEGCDNEVTLQLGDPDSKTKNLLTIDGNKDNLTTTVTGSVLFVVGGAGAELYENVTISNHKKLGNEKTLTEAYDVSYANQVGGAVAIIAAKATMEIFGGTYSNNVASDVASSDSNHGGAFYNHGVLNVYGGVFQNNTAARGAVIYCYRTTRIYNAQILNNSASTYGGAIYMPNSTAAFLYLGGENPYGQSSVVFQENTAKSGGGAIYAKNKLEGQDVQFIRNSTTGGSGGAVTAGAMQLSFANTVFDGNTAKSYGAAIHYANENGKEGVYDLICADVTFRNNSATATGGAIYMNGNATANMKNVAFTSNTAKNNGGAIYLNNGHVTIENGSFTSNSANTGGAVCLTGGASLDMNSGSFTKNTGAENGGAISLNSSSSAVLSRITASENSATAGPGGFSYVIESTLTLYRSKIEKNTSTGHGGAIYMYTSASGAIYDTDFDQNTATGSGMNGGALALYTGETEVLVHSCDFTRNASANFGGAIWVSGKTIAKLYNITAQNNSAKYGGFMYHTTASTTVTLAGLTVSGNTATTGGPIIWGNTYNAKLYIDKSKYTDSDHTGALDSAYWSSAIANKLTVYDTSEEIPNWLDYREETYDHMADAVDVSTAQQLEDAIASGAPHIRVIADFEVDRTFYITGKTTIFSTLPRTLTRAPGFGGDLFVVGENAEGTSALLLGGNAKLVLGNPLSTQENLLVIDGNKDNMAVPVVGSALFISYGGLVDVHTNLTAKNLQKTDNQRAYKEEYNLSRPNRIGGAFAIVANGSLSIHGGNYYDNLVNEENAATEEGRNSTVGGLLYNNSNVYIYGGTFRNNQAARGGIIYNYRILKIYSGSFIENTATVMGAVVYAPNAATSHTHIGTADADGGQVLIQNNISANNGGAMYISSLCVMVIHGNTTFEGNVSNGGSGGAICSYGSLTVRDTVFAGNSAKSHGGAVYISKNSGTYLTRINNLEGCTFENNTATLGGALSVYATDSEYEFGAIATVSDCQFTGNQAASSTSKTTASYGGAVYLERKSELTLKETTFKQNSARTEGGAIYAGGGSKLSVDSSIFTQNAILEKGKHGGAIAIHSVTLNLTDTNFTGNTATLQAGALYISYASALDRNSEVTINGGTFKNNTAEGVGGAIYVTRQKVTEEKQILRINGTGFTGNSALTGGALYFVAGTTAYMTDTTFSKNKATESAGGAIFSSGGNIELDTATFNQNTATTNGGAIYLGDDSQAVLYKMTATGNAATGNGGFLYVSKSALNMYDSLVKGNTATVNGGGITLQNGAAANIYATEFVENVATENGGGLFLYTDLTPCLIHSCSFTGNRGVLGGGIYASGKAVASLYNITARNNAAQKGGFMDETTTGTELTLVGLTVAGNSASSGGPIIWGNSTGATLHLDKSKVTDEDHAGALDDAYWATAIVNKLTVKEITASAPAYEPYESKRDDGGKTPATKEPVPVQDVFNVSQNSSNADINSTYAKLPRLDNSSNFMSKNVTTFESINGGTVTVDSFIYPAYGTADNCNVGMGLLIWQAICYKQAYPEQDVYIDVSSYRFSVQAAVNINRNSRYFGYMRQLSGKNNYDQYGFVRIAYLLITAAKMGIHVTAIGHIDAYPTSSDSLLLNDYFTTQLGDPCDPAYVQDSVIGDYLNFTKVDWDLQEKGGTDMMHTKMCAVSHYLDMNGVAHENAVFSSSSNLDGITSKAYNANWKVQTATIVTGHKAIYETSVNYLRLIPDYQGQEGVYEFQDVVNRRSTQQAQMILAGKENEIPAGEQIIYLGRDTDPVFELYFTPMGGDILAWDEVQNPYCKYLRKLYDSEDYILFTWNAAEYSSGWTFGDQIESMIIEAFHKNRNVNNKIYGNMENFDASTFDDLVEGVDIGFKSFNQLDFGKVHNKDLQFSYVENGQRYYVSLLNSMNFHGGSMYFQSNFALVIKETECKEDGVFFTLAENTTKGIVEHEYLDTVLEYLPETGEDGYTYHPCANCDKKQILDVVHRSGDWQIVRETTKEEHGVAQRSCTNCGMLLETREYAHSGDATQIDQSMFAGKKFSYLMDVQDRLELTSTPKTIEATIQLDKTQNERGGVIVGNYDNSGKNQLNLEIHRGGKVRLFLVNNGTRLSHNFETDVRSYEPVHIAVTLDGYTASLYVDGELKETAQLTQQIPELSGTFWIGGDNRGGNGQYFKGSIYNVNLFSDVRTEAEIHQDTVVVFPDEKDLLVSQNYKEESILPQQMKTFGKTFNRNTADRVGYLFSTPKTIEATIQLDKSHNERGGVILGNYNNSTNKQLNLEIYFNGRPRLYIHDGTSSATYTFPVDVRSDAPVHLAITFDDMIATLYVNGEIAGTQTMNCALPDITKDMMIGGDNRNGNALYFKGTIYSVSLFSEARTVEQIKNDIVNIPATEDHLMFSGKYVTDEILIDADGGRIFQKDRVCNIGKLSSTPVTMEAVIQVDKSIDTRAGVIVGSYDSTLRDKLTLEVYSQGQLRLFYQTASGKKASRIFTTDIRSDKPVHIAVTVLDLVAILYVNGVQVEQQTLPFAIPQIAENYSIGGDDRPGNSYYFRGTIYSVSLFGDVRTPNEILEDISGVSANADNLLYTRDYKQPSLAATDFAMEYGKKFTAEETFYTSKITKAPLTMEAVVKLDASVTDRGGVIVGNYDNSAKNQINLEIYTNGNVRLFFRSNDMRMSHIFQTDIRSDKAVHIAVTVDGKLASLYINGELKETALLLHEMPAVSETFCVGGEKRSGNTRYFKGTIYSVNLFSEVRTAEQIKNDVIAVDTTDSALLDSIMFTQDICAQNGHVASDWIEDIADPDAPNSISHTQCLLCGKGMQYQKVPQKDELVGSRVFENAPGFKPTQQDSIYVDTLTTAPHTFEATIQLDKSFSQRAGVIIGNYNGTRDDQINLEIYSNGLPRLYYRVNGTAYTYNFKTDIRSAGLTHIALTVDGLTAKLYVNGKLKETIALSVALPEITSGFVVGGDNRTDNAQYFKGTIYAAHMFSDVRTAEEIAVDQYMLTQDAEDVLVSKYFLTEETDLAGKTIVNFGDSIFGNYKSPVDISTMIADKTGATVYNVGFGGAQMSETSNVRYDAFGMENLADAITTGDFSLQEKHYTKEERFVAPFNTLKSIDFNTVDIITIAYGTNDFKNGKSLDDVKNAAKYSIETIKNKYPYIDIVLCIPVYRYWIDDAGNFVEDSNTKEINGIKLTDYIQLYKDIGKEYGLVVIDNYNGSGITASNRADCFTGTDTTHPNETGRQMIAENMAEELCKHFA